MIPCCGWNVCIGVRVRLGMVCWVCAIRMGGAVVDGLGDDWD